MERQKYNIEVNNCFQCLLDKYDISFNVDLNTQKEIKQCMSCENKVPYSSGVFTCYECSN